MKKEHVRSLVAHQPRCFSNVFLPFCDIIDMLLQKQRLMQVFILNFGLKVYFSNLFLPFCDIIDRLLQKQRLMQVFILNFRLKVASG
jgi:hypothetical protein